MQLARHPKRPYSSDYISRITDYWFELHGDRYFSDDPSMVCGIAKIDTLNLMIISQEKGRGTKSKVFRNFGMARPEGYRKALRLMKLAEKYNISAERVRQIEVRAFEKLQKSMLNSSKSKNLLPKN